MTGGDAAAQQVEVWQSVAAGWERQRELLARATVRLSERMVELLDPKPGDRVLELAAGPGETGFRVLPRVQPGGELVLTDIAPEMVESARRRAAELGLGSITFGVEDAAALSVPDAAFDRVLCRFGIMLVPEMERVAHEISRVLVPDGRAVLAVWASPGLNPWMTAGGRASLELGLVEPPDPDGPGPFRLADPDRLRSVVAAGLRIESIEDVTVTWEARSLDEWWQATCDMSPTLSSLVGQLPPEALAELRGRAGEYLQEYLEDDGSLIVPGLAHVVVATPA